MFNFNLFSATNELFVINVFNFDTNRSALAMQSCWCCCRCGLLPFVFCLDNCFVINACTTLANFMEVEYFVGFDKRQPSNHSISRCNTGGEVSTTPLMDNNVFRSPSVLSDGSKIVLVLSLLLLLLTLELLPPPPPPCACVPPSRCLQVDSSSSAPSRTWPRPVTTTYSAVGCV